jgi:ketosteroid isomerase-like protein
MQLNRVPAMRSVWSVGLLITGLTSGCMSLQAHPIDPAPAHNAKAAAEVRAMRSQFQAAALRKDAGALRQFYTDDFTHTHTSGKVDGKDARIVSVLAEEATVEMAPTPEFNLSCFGDAVCIARALSPIKRASDGRWFDVRWTQTFVKTSKGWQIAISQATGLPATLRDQP